MRVGCFHDLVHVDPRGYAFCQYCGRYFGHSEYFAAVLDEGLVVDKEQWFTRRSCLLPTEPLGLPLEWSD
jgi:hypothetical protein